MIPGICVAVGALMFLCLRRRQKPMSRDEITRLAAYSDKVRREDVHAFE